MAAFGAPAVPARSVPRQQGPSRDSQMTRQAVGTPCSSPPDVIITPSSGEPPGPSPSGGHEKHPGLAAARLTYVFQLGMLYP